MSRSKQLAANMIRLQKEAHGKDFEEWHSAMSYRIFLLERELGYQITGDMNGLALMERLNMQIRYYEEQNKSYNDSSTKSGKKGGKGKGLIK